MNIKCLPEKLLSDLKNLSLQSEIEVCGFIKNNFPGSYFFENCKNIHPEPEKYFLISKNDYLNNLDSVLFHSHPKGDFDNGFSNWDVENQKFHCLDMVLYSVNNDKFYYKNYDNC